MAGVVEVEANLHLTITWNLKSFHIFTLAIAILDISISNFLPSKSRSMSQSTIFIMLSFDGKHQNLQKSSHAFLC